MGTWNVPAVAKAAVPVVTVNSKGGNGLIGAYLAAGLKVIVVIEGPYSKTGGVRSLDPVAWAANAVAIYNANPGITAIEELNEPAGSWFWGSNAGSALEAAAYAKLLKATRAAFTANGKAPLLLASFDGGRITSNAWGGLVKAADPLAYTYVDGVTVHPYGDVVNKAASALGGRSHVTEAAQQSGRPVWITELGWPTATGQPPTGDSLQWTEAEQAANITGYIAWARTQPYIAAVTIFMYSDYGTNMWYGIVRNDPSQSHKPSFAALAAVSR